MQETSMRHSVIIVLFFILAFSLAGKNKFSDNSQLTDRIDAICDSINDGHGDKLLPELFIMKDSIERASIFDAYNYVHVVWCINSINVLQQDLEAFRNTIDDAFDFFDKMGINEDPSVRILYLNRAIFWARVSNWLEAKKDLEYSKRIFEQIDDTSEEYACCLMCLATVLSSDDKALDLVNSRLYVEEAMGIIENYCKEKNIPRSAGFYDCMNTLASLHLKMGDLHTSQQIFKDIISTIEDDGRSFDNIRALAYNNLCYCLLLDGNPREAFVVASDALKGISDYRTMDYMYQNIILSLIQTNNIAVDDWLAQYNEFAKTNVSNIFSTFTEKERDAYWTTQSQTLLACNNLVANKRNSPSSLIMAYDNAIYTKTLLLKSNLLLPRIINKCGKPELIKQYQLMTNLKEKLNDKTTPEDSITKYQNRINNIEKQLINSIPSFGKMVVDDIPTFNAIKNSLGKKDVAVEFTILPEIEEKAHRFYYGALLTRHDYSCPKLIKLCDVDVIDEIMDHDYNKLWVNNYYSSYNDSIYRLFWQPLEKHLHKGDNVFCSLSNELSKINVGALSNGKKRLMDVYNIFIVSSTGSLAEAKGLTNYYHSALIYGGIDYAEPPEEMMNKSAMTRNAFADFLASRSIDRSYNWINLVATGYEATQIENVLKHNHIKTLYLNGRNANEESFKSLTGTAPDILHIATHGFFLPEPKDRKSLFFSNINSFSQKNESMLYSGLLFAGANNVWNGLSIKPDIDDGILTADEVSRLDLGNCKLVVLSACNTGLGTIDIVDGVFGLQRGFKQAGVSSIVMSLWKVDDQATAELMIEFYQSLTEGLTPHQALDKAKRELIKNERFSDPYYWAAFVLLD